MYTKRQMHNHTTIHLALLSPLSSSHSITHHQPLTHPQLSNVFAGKHGFITPRDLFRWAGRGAVGYQALAEAGYMVLGERLRVEEEQATVLSVLNKLLKAKVRCVGWGTLYIQCRSLAPIVNTIAE